MHTHARMVVNLNQLAAMLRWFTAEGAIRIAVRQLSQTSKLRHYDVIDDVITSETIRDRQKQDHIAP